jgi:hypothetical protein
MDASMLLMDAVVGILTALCLGVLVWGGWLCIGSEGKKRQSGAR